MSASTTDGLDMGDVKCDMLEIIDRIFNNVLDLHFSNVVHIVYFDVTVFLEVFCKYAYFHYLSCFWERCSIFCSCTFFKVLFCFEGMPWAFSVDNLICFLLLFQLCQLIPGRVVVESAVDLIFIFPFLSQDFSEVTSDCDVTHGWITSIIPSCQLYVLVLFSPISWNALSLLPFGYIVTS